MNLNILVSSCRFPQTREQQMHLVVHNPCEEYILTTVKMKRETKLLPQKIKATENPQEICKMFRLPFQPILPFSRTPAFGAAASHPGASQRHRWGAAAGPQQGAGGRLETSAAGSKWRPGVVAGEGMPGDLSLVDECWWVGVWQTRIQDISGWDLDNQTIIHELGCDIVIMSNIWDIQIVPNTQWLPPALWRRPRGRVLRWGKVFEGRFAACTRFWARHLPDQHLAGCGQTGSWRLGTALSPLMWPGWFKKHRENKQMLQQNEVWLHFSFGCCFFFISSQLIHIFRIFHFFRGGVASIQWPDRIVSAGGSECHKRSCWWNCFVSTTWTPCRAHQQHRFLFGEQCGAGRPICFAQAGDVQSAGVFFCWVSGLFESTAKWGIPKSIHHYFPNSKSWGHTPFSDRPSGFSGDAGTQRWSRESWFLIGTFIMGKARRKSSGKTPGCSLSVWILVQNSYVHVASCFKLPESNQLDTSCHPHFRYFFVSEKPATTEAFVFQGLLPSLRLCTGSWCGTWPWLYGECGLTPRIHRCMSAVCMSRRAGPCCRALSAGFVAGQRRIWCHGWRPFGGSQVHSWWFCKDHPLTQWPGAKALWRSLIAGFGRWLPWVPAWWFQKRFNHSFFLFPSFSYVGWWHAITDLFRWLETHQACFVILLGSCCRDSPPWWWHWELQQLRRETFAGVTEGDLGNTFGAS